MVSCRRYRTGNGVVGGSVVMLSWLMAISSFVLLLRLEVAEANVLSLGYSRPADEYPFDEDSCHFCYRNAEPDPSVRQDKTLFVTSSGRDVTCKDWSRFMSSFKKDALSNGRCLGYQFLTSYYCGCPEPPPPPCTLCTDGSPPAQLENVVVTPNGNHTCRAHVIFAAREPFGETADENPNRRALSCRRWQEVGTATCGCPIPKKTPCQTLCPNNVPAPFPDRVVFQHGITCGEMEKRLSVYDGEQCEVLQRTVGLSCSCPNIQMQEEETKPAKFERMGLCRVCGTGIPLRNPLAITKSTTGEEYTCAQIEFGATRDPARNCAFAKAIHQQDCCQEERVSDPQFFSLPQGQTPSPSAPNLPPTPSPRPPSPSLPKGAPPMPSSSSSSSSSLDEPTHTHSKVPPMPSYRAKPPSKKPPTMNKESFRLRPPVKMAADNRPDTR